MDNKVRLNKFIANNGDISRRTADEYIQQRRVTVNNITVDFPAYDVDIENDKVRVDGELIKIQTKKVYIALNKPANVVSTVSDERKRTTVIDLVNVNLKIYPVGRLDYDTTGLILLTNDGELADSLMHPRNKVDKTYLVKLSKPLEESHRHLLEKGIILEGKRTQPAEIKFVNRHGFDRLYITIHEGRNKQVKKMFERFGYFVDKLERTQFGSIHIGTLAKGKWRYLTPEEVKKLSQKNTGDSSTSIAAKSTAKSTPKDTEKSLEKSSKERGTKRTTKRAVKSTDRRKKKITKKGSSKSNPKTGSKSGSKSTFKRASKKTSKKSTFKGKVTGAKKFTRKSSNKK